MGKALLCSQFRCLSQLGPLHKHAGPPPEVAPCWQSPSRTPPPCLWLRSHMCTCEPGKGLQLAHADQQLRATQPAPPPQIPPWLVECPHLAAAPKKSAHGVFCATTLLLFLVQNGLGPHATAQHVRPGEIEEQRVWLKSQDPYLWSQMQVVSGHVVF